MIVFVYLNDKKNKVFHFASVRLGRASGLMLAGPRPVARGGFVRLHDTISADQANRLISAWEDDAGIIAELPRTTTACRVEEKHRHPPVALGIWDTHARRVPSLPTTFDQNRVKAWRGEHAMNSRWVAPLLHSWQTLGKNHSQPNTSIMTRYAAAAENLMGEPTNG